MPAAATAKPEVKGFYECRTCSIQYVVSDPATKRCAIIDPVLDFDEKSGATATVQADLILDYVAENGLTVEWILDTHPHADHFSAAAYLKERTCAPTGIGSGIVRVQKLWKDIYNWPELEADGSQWDHLFDEGERFSLGSIEARVLYSPGHTLASITYVVGDAAFVHDTMFMPDSGTARADFPGGDARQLWHSIGEILALPDETRVFTRARLPPGRSRAALGKHGRRGEALQSPYRRRERGSVRSIARGTRQDAADAEADPARIAGQYSWRPLAGPGGQRRALFEVSAQCAEGSGMGLNGDANGHQMSKPRSGHGRAGGRSGGASQDACKPEPADDRRYARRRRAFGGPVGRDARHSPADLVATADRAAGDGHRWRRGATPSRSSIALPKKGLCD
ncbi:glyoxylase-like metal-dependent hydrolase (beta-lactamase superfamily II) [Sinorhizobium fredii]